MARAAAAAAGREHVRQRVALPRQNTIIFRATIKRINNSTARRLLIFFPYTPEIATRDKFCRRPQLHVLTWLYIIMTNISYDAYFILFSVRTIITYRNIRPDRNSPRGPLVVWNFHSGRCDFFYLFIFLWISSITAEKPECLRRTVFFRYKQKLTQNTVAFLDMVKLL